MTPDNSLPETWPLLLLLAAVAASLVWYLFIAKDD